MIEYAMNTAGMTPEQIEAAHAAVDQVDYCQVCGLVLAVGEFPCITSIRRHARAERLFNVISDEIQGGFTQEHFGVQPETFYSKRAMALRAKELGLVPMVRHVGENHTDKSSKTSRWI